jgi:hypothetical protein
VVDRSHTHLFNFGFGADVDHLSLDRILSREPEHRRRTVVASFEDVGSPVL